jgi:hypothetical protein
MDELGVEMRAKGIKGEISLFLEIVDMRSMT